MLVQQLYALARRLEEAGRLPPAYHKATGVKWALELDTDGGFLGWSKLGDGAQGLEEVVPYFKRSGKSPPAYLLVDNFSYVLGARLSEEDKFKDARLASNFEAYTKLIADLVAYARECESPHADDVSALARFLADDRERERAIEDARADETKGVRDLVAPYVDGHPLHRLEIVRRFWASRRDGALIESSKLNATCMLTGEEGAIAATHPTAILLGPNRVGLVSANPNAFESYGLESSAIAPVKVPPARV